MDFEKILKDIFCTGYSQAENQSLTEGIEEVIALDKTHTEKKKLLGHRVQVLRILIMNYHNPYLAKMDSYEFHRRCEKYLDNLLKKRNYQLEKIIDEMREHVTLENPCTNCNTCSYMPPFCNCD